MIRSTPRGYYIPCSVLGLALTFISRLLLSSKIPKWYPVSKPYNINSIFLLQLANHPVAGILLGFSGFMLLFYILFVTALKLHHHWGDMGFMLRIFMIPWIMILGTSALSSASLLYDILGYLFFLTAVLLFLLLILCYFIPENE